MVIAVVAVCAAFISIAPAATAAGESGVVSSERSFPKASSARKDLLKESTSTDVEQDSNWGGIESLDVPKTKSQAEKDAEAKAQQEAAAAAAAAQARSQSSSASRSGSRSNLSTAGSGASSFNLGSVEAPTSSNGAAVVSYAAQFQGVPYVYGGTTPSGFDCSGFTQYVYAAFGISLPRVDNQQRVWAQANGTKVSNPQPGDLMWRPGHVGIYVGNGMMIHAPRPGKSVSIVPVYASFEYYRVI